MGGGGDREDEGEGEGTEGDKWKAKYKEPPAAEALSASS